MRIKEEYTISRQAVLLLEVLYICFECIVWGNFMLDRSNSHLDHVGALAQETFWRPSGLMLEISTVKEKQVDSVGGGMRFWSASGGSILLTLGWWVQGNLDSGRMMGRNVGEDPG